MLITHNFLPFKLNMVEIPINLVNHSEYRIILDPTNNLIYLFTLLFTHFNSPASPLRPFVHLHTEMTTRAMTNITKAPMITFLQSLTWKPAARENTWYILLWLTLSSCNVFYFLKMKQKDFKRVKTSKQCFVRIQSLCSNFSTDSVTQDTRSRVLTGPGGGGRSRCLLCLSVTDGRRCGCRVWKKIKQWKDKRVCHEELSN